MSSIGITFARLVAGDVMPRAVPGLILLTFLLVSCGRLHVGDDEKGRSRGGEIETAIQQAVRGKKPPEYVTRDREGSRMWKKIGAFYQQRDFTPAWIQGRAPRPQMDALIRAVHAAEREGLDPELYSASLLDRRKQEASKGFLTSKGFDPGEAVAMDVWLSWLYLKLASDLASGVSDLAHADPSWKISPKSFDPLPRLEAALRDNRVAESLFELTPTHHDYRALQKVLQDYRRQAAGGGWPDVPSALRLKAGQTTLQAAALARRLAASGDYPGAVPPEGRSVAYGPDLQEAVRRFQRRHGLADDGVAGPALASELNVPLEARIRQIELNLERWRWLPRELGDPYILVNIPEMRLEVWEHGAVPISMRVVVGKPDTQTPIFNDTMTYLVFAPYWNVPTDIAAKETLPAVLRDPGFLNRMNMEVVDASGEAIDPESIDLESPDSYRFRQRPGTSNALGLVKFMFPNQFNVYLHDTPADSLFERASRSLSHGCVRLEEPQRLAEYVLRDQQEWTADRIREAMHGDEERTVKLKHPIPVYLGYWTTRVSGDGTVQFRKDVYGIEGRLSAKLAERLDRMKTSATAAIAATSPDPQVGQQVKR
jgi:murein L,D-transpeptidase YcbB/YkuD